MVKLMNICQMSPSIVAMDILIEGNKEKKVSFNFGFIIGWNLYRKTSYDST